MNTKNKLLKIGITGQAGFMGTHLYNYLGLKENVELVPFEDSYFDHSGELCDFVRSCDTIVHLAAMNRHEDQQVIYKTNLELVQKLIAACEQEKVNPHIIFSSSTQEERDNPYGNSKKEGRKLFEEWADRSGTKFTALVIPNVYGPFGKPYYNSVVATFCHQLTHGETPQIQVDGNIKLIYIGELVEVFYSAIQCALPGGDPSDVVRFKVPHSVEKKVSELLELMEGFKSNYLEEGILPDFTNSFVRNLFNTFVCYIDLQQHYPVHLTLHTDDRGSFVETVKLNSGGQVSFSTTKPGITRGNHFHIRKAERFAVINGRARIQLRRIGTSEVLNFDLDGSKPSYVDMPVWYTHNITNTGDDELLTLFWISEHFNSDDPDTYFEKV